MGHLTFVESGAGKLPGQIGSWLQLRLQALSRCWRIVIHVLYVHPLHYVSPQPQSLCCHCRFDPTVSEALFAQKPLISDS